MAVPPEDMDHLIKFGDTCCLFDADIQGCVTAPLTSNISAPVVVLPRGKDGITPGNSQACLFQILNRDKYAATSKLGKKIRILQKKQRDADRREQEDLHQARMMSKREIQRKANAGFVPGHSKRVKGVGFSGEVDDDDFELMKRTIEPDLDVAKAIDVVPQRYKDAALAEARDNELEQRRRFSTAVRYGDVVQLWNPFSKRFLKVSALSNALLEPSSMRIEMSAAADDCCHFKIMPRYKIRSEGDEIRDEDEVVFESMHASGQYLHSADRIELRFDDLDENDTSQCPLDKAYEITAAVNKGSYKIMQYSRPLEHKCREHGSPLEKFLYDFAKAEEYTSEINLVAGDVIQLFHKDSDSFIAAEGTQKDPYSDQIVHAANLDIHMRNRKPDPERPNRLEPPTSATTFFMVEHRNPREGGPVAWGDAVRLKHVPTGLYLSLGVDADFPNQQQRQLGERTSSMSGRTTSISGSKLAGTNSTLYDGFGSDGVQEQQYSPKLVELSPTVLDSTLFELHNESLVGVGADRFVDSDAYVRIQHKLSRQWLHPTRDEFQRPRNKVCNMSGLPSDAASSNVGFVLESDGGLDIDANFLDPLDDSNAGAFVNALERLKWDNATLFKLATKPIHNFDDAFSVRLVDPDLAFYTNYIAGFLPFFQRYACLRERRELNSFEAEELARQLNELDDFMYVKRLPQKQRTKQLRTLGIVDVLIRMLQAPFRQTPFSTARISSYNDVVKHENTEIIMINVFRLLQTFLKGECRKNELFMCQYGEFLWQLFGTEMRVEPMFNELVRDNMKVVQEVTEAEIRRVIHLMSNSKDRNPFYLEFFSVLCVCDNDPYRRHQASIGRLLLELPSKPPVFLTDVVRTSPDSHPTLMVSVTGSEADRIPLEDFALSALDEVDKTSSEEYLFLQRQLELFGNLCKGRMSSNIELISQKRKYLTWEECFMCATARSETHETAYQRRKNQPISKREVPPGVPGMGNMFLPRSLRKIYVDLLVNLFVNVGDNRDVLSKVRLNYNWDEVTRTYYDVAAKNHTIALSGAEFKQFPILRDWLKWELGRVSCLTHVDRYMGQPFNKLLASMLNLLHFLIKFGYYASGDDIGALMEPLEGVINGMNDQKEMENMYKSDSLKSSKSAVSQFEDTNDPAYLERERKIWLNNSRYKLDDDGLAVMEAKFLALSCINSLFNHIFNVRLRFLLADFKNSLNPKAVSKRPGMSIRKSSAQINSVFDAVFEAQTDEELYALSKRVRSYLNDLSESCNWILSECDPGWDISKAWTYRNPSEPDNPTLIEVLLDLSKYEGHYPLLSLSMSLVARIYTMQENLYTKAVQAVILMTQESKHFGEELEILVPLLNREGAGVISGKSVETFIDVLRYLTARCYKISNRLTKNVNSVVFNADDPGEQHSMNQQIIFNTRIMSTVVDAIVTDGQEPVVLSCCFEFLRALATGYPMIQQRLMGSLDILLQAEVAAVPNTDISKLAERKGWNYRSWQDSMGLAICELFIGCKETCIGIRPNQVEQILDLLAVHSTDAPTFLDALEAIAKVEEYDLPLKRNQQLTVKNLMLYRDTLIDVAYIDDNSNETINEQRLELIRSALDRDGRPNEKLRHYHLSLVKLLASTCEGENRQIEATCRSIFKLEELVETISDRKISPIFKTAYLKFLLWVYLNAEGSVAEIGTDAIERDPDMTLLKGLNQIGKSFLGKCYHASTGDHASIDDRSSTLEHAAFVFDAFLPTLYIIATKHMPRTGKEHAEAMKLIVELVQPILDCINRVIESRRGNEHLNNFRALTVANLLLHLGKLVKNDSLARQVKKVSEVISERIENHDAGITPRPLNTLMRGVTASEDTEIDLNARFNSFAKKLGIAYGGANIVKEQLAPIASVQPGMGRMKNAEKNSQYCEPPGSDETFPLGPEFQYFTRVFSQSARGTGFLDGLNLKNLNKINVLAKSTPEMEGDRTKVHEAAMSALVRLWRGALTYQAQADILDREANVTVIDRTLMGIRAMLHNESLSVDQTSHLQADIVRTKAVLPIAMLLGATSPKLKREVLSLSKALLADGHADTQKAFARHFLGTREETFFTDVSTLITQSDTAIKERRELLKQKAVADASRAQVRETMRTTLGKSHAKKLATNLQEGEIKSDVLNQETAEEDTDNSRLVFCVLQSMCEGHNTILQDYLRAQPDNLKSFNLIEMTSRFLLTITDDLVNNSHTDADDQENIEELVEQCLSTIVEFVQGNVDNQECVFNARSTDAVNLLIRQPLGIFKELREEYETGLLSGELSTELLETKLGAYRNRATLDYGCATLIASQLEANDDRTIRLAREIDKALDIGCILTKMAQYLALEKMTSKGFAFKDETDETDKGFSPFTIAFAFYNIVVRLSDFTHKSYHNVPSYVRQDRQWREDLKLVKHPALALSESSASRHKGGLDADYHTLEKNTGVIEVMMNDELQKVHFYIRPEWRRQLRSDVKDALLWNVDRSSTADGVRDFAERCKTVIADMKYLSEVQEFSIVTNMILQHKSLFNSVVIWLSYIINLLMLIVWQAPDIEYRSPKPQYAYDFWEKENLFLILWLAHLLATSLATAAYFLAFPPSWTALYYDMYGLIFGMQLLEEKLKSNKPTGTLGQTSMRDVDHGDLFDGENIDDAKVEQAEQQDAVFKAQVIISDINDKGLIDRHHYKTRTSPLSSLSFYHIVFLGMSMAGYSTHGYTLSFHLLHIIIGNQTLSRVIQSVTKNGSTLLYVALLIMVMIYIFNLVVFAFMRKDLDPLDGAFCETLAQCFVTSVRYGLLSGGGLGEAVSQETYSFNEPFYRFFFDIAFFVLITTIGLNVVFGIIVDTFSELRDDKYKTVELMNSQCFICGRQSYDFQRYGKGFRNHIKHEHHMWNYLFYFAHLDSIRATEYNAIEQFVAEKLYTEMYDFFPINKALVLSGVEDEADELNEIQADLQIIKDMLEKAREVEKEEDLQEQLRRERLNDV